MCLGCTATRGVLCGTLLVVAFGPCFLGPTASSLMRPGNVLANGVVELLLFARCTASLEKVPLALTEGQARSSLLQCRQRFRGGCSVSLGDQHGGGDQSRPAVSLGAVNVDRPSPTRHPLNHSPKTVLGGDPGIEYGEGHVASACPNRLDLGKLGGKVHDQRDSLGQFVGQRSPTDEQIRGNLVIRFLAGCQTKNVPSEPHEQQVRQKKGNCIPSHRAIRSLSQRTGPKPKIGCAHPGETESWPHEHPPPASETCGLEEEGASYDQE